MIERRQQRQEHFLLSKIESDITWLNELCQGVTRYELSKDSTGLYHLHKIEIKTGDIVRSFYSDDLVKIYYYVQTLTHIELMYRF